MTWRWIVWSAAIAALAALALFPLRLALGLSDFERMGFTARQVAGTIWYGRIGELHLRSQPLGTLEVALNPLPLLIGNVSMHFRRMESPDGPLEGKLVAGFRRGIVEANGRLAVGNMFGRLPLAALELEEVTVLFSGGQCSAAGGRVRPILSAPIPGMTIDPGIAGTIECDGERARVRMKSPSGAETIEFYVRDSGEYRAWMSIRTARPELSGALSLFGFRPSPQGMTLTVDGRL